MKLSRLTLQDFRGFGAAEFDFMDPESGKPLDVVLLVGDNGSGKTSVLHAIAGVMGEVVGVDSGYEHIGRKDVRDGCEETTVSLWMKSAERNAATKFAYSFPIGMLQNGPFLESADSLRRLQKDYENGLELIALFDVYRLLQNISIEGPTRFSVLRHPCQKSLAPTLGRAGGIQARFGQLKQWIVNLDFLRTKAKLDRGEDLPTWGLLIDALDQLLAPNRFIGVDDEFEIYFQTPHGRVPIQALSDGFRSIFVIVVDLLLRMSLMTPRREDALLQEAVCLIDEIDAHLHPRLQSRVIPALRTLFPNVQFIATTHSPFIVESVEAKNIFQLSAEEPAL